MDALATLIAAHVQDHRVKAFATMILGDEGLRGAAKEFVATLRAFLASDEFSTRRPRCCAPARRSRRAA